MADSAPRPRPRPDLMGGPDVPSDVMAGGREPAGENPDVMRGPQEPTGTEPDVMSDEHEDPPAAR